MAAIHVIRMFSLECPMVTVIPEPDSPIATTPAVVRQEKPVPFMFIKGRYPANRSQLATKPSHHHLEGLVMSTEDLSHLAVLSTRPF